MMHFIWQHLGRVLAGWFVLSVVCLAIYVFIMAETPEQRIARRKKEKAEAAKLHLRRVVQYHVQRRQREVLRLVAQQGEDVLAQVEDEFEAQAFSLDHDNRTEVDGGRAA